MVQCVRACMYPARHQKASYFSRDMGDPNALLNEAYISKEKNRGTRLAGLSGCSCLSRNL